jgi:dTDP-4-dehydrorhamnose reductase
VLSSKVTAAPQHLVIGGAGLLGAALRQRWEAQGVKTIVTTRETLDLGGDIARWHPPAGGGVAVISAGITDQEKCRRDPAGTGRINIDQTILLAQRLRAADYFVVYLSSNLVFDGSAAGPRPADAVSPATEYGRQKAAAEQGLRDVTDELAIVRLTKVVHQNLPLLARWREALQRGEVIRPFRDYVCSPISLAFAVAGIAAAAEKRAPGIWHISANDDLPYSELARALARNLGAPEALVQSTAAPHGTLEHLPEHAFLDTADTEKQLGLKTPSAREALDFA